MKIHVDRTKCTGHGVCESFAPNLFEVNDDGDMVLNSDVVPDEMVDDVRQAVDGCPPLALSLEE
jgi:ferredoxin